MLQENKSNSIYKHLTKILEQKLNIVGYNVFSNDKEGKEEME